jgi:hypothetical protein
MRACALRRGKGYSIKDTDRKFLDRIADVLAILEVDVPVEPLVYTPDELQRLADEGRDFILTLLKEAKLCYEAKQQ